MSKFRRSPDGHDPLVLVSMVQKAIRRNRPDLAAYAANQLIGAGYRNWLWRRLCVTAAKDCASLIQDEINALRDACDREAKDRRGSKGTRVFWGKAVLILCRAYKSRDVDHMNNLCVDAGAIPETDIDDVLAEAERDPQQEIPDYVYDVHTEQGRRADKTKRQFFKDEHGR